MGWLQACKASTLKRFWIENGSSIAVDMAVGARIPAVSDHRPALRQLRQEQFDLKISNYCRNKGTYMLPLGKTSDVPENHREEGEMVIPSYGYFIRGAQTTFSGVLRDRQWKYTLCRMTDFDCQFENY